LRCTKVLNRANHDRRFDWPSCILRAAILAQRVSRASCKKRVHRPCKSTAARRITANATFVSAAASVPRASFGGRHGMDAPLSRMPRESPASPRRSSARNHRQDLGRSESPSSGARSQPLRSAHPLRSKRRPANRARRTSRPGAWNTWDRPPLREFLAAQVAHPRCTCFVFGVLTHVDQQCIFLRARSFFQRCHRRDDSRTGFCAADKIGQCHWPLWLKGVIQLVLSLFKPLGRGASHAHRRALFGLGAVGKHGAKRYRCRYVPCRVGAQTSR